MILSRRWEYFASSYFSLCSFQERQMYPFEFGYISVRGRLFTIVIGLPISFRTRSPWNKMPIILFIFLQTPYMFVILHNVNPSPITTISKVLLPSSNTSMRRYSSKSSSPDSHGQITFFVPSYNFILLRHPGGCWELFVTWMMWLMR